MGISYAFVNLVAKIRNNLLNALFYKKRCLERIILPISRLQNALFYQFRACKTHYTDLN